MSPSKAPPAYGSTIIRTSGITIEAYCRNAISIDVHRDLLVCFFVDCLSTTGRIRREIKTFGTSATALRNFAVLAKDLHP